MGVSRGPAGARFGVPCCGTFRGHDDDWASGGISRIHFRAALWARSMRPRLVPTIMPAPSGRPQDAPAVSGRACLHERSGPRCVGQTRSRVLRRQVDGRRMAPRGTMVAVIRRSGTGAVTKNEEPGRLSDICQVTRLPAPSVDPAFLAALSIRATTNQHATRRRAQRHRNPDACNNAAPPAPNARTAADHVPNARISRPRTNHATNRAANRADPARFTELDIMSIIGVLQRISAQRFRCRAPGRSRGCVSR